MEGSRGRGEARRGMEGLEGRLTWRAAGGLGRGGYARRVSPRPRESRAGNGRRGASSCNLTVWDGDEAGGARRGREGASCGGVGSVPDAKGHLGGGGLRRGGYARGVRPGVPPREWRGGR